MSLPNTIATGVDAAFSALKDLVEDTTVKSKSANTTWNSTTKAMVHSTKKETVSLLPLSFELNDTDGTNIKKGDVKALVQVSKIPDTVKLEKGVLVERSDGTLWEVQNSVLTPGNALLSVQLRKYSG